MKQQICYIFGAGSITEETIPLADCRYVIAADAGLRYLDEHHISADLVLGDFDSLGQTPEHPNLLVYPSQKDDTDMLLAVREGLNRGFREFVLYGGLGGRLDHTLANLQTLCFLAEQNAIGYLIGEHTAVTAVKNGTLHFPSSREGIVSVFCLGGPAKGVFLKNLKYELTDYEMTATFPIGVSNEFIGEASTITVSDGIVLVVWSHDETKILDYVMKT